jgi:hypothetical protein
MPALRRLLALILPAILISALAGCGGRPDSQESRWRDEVNSCLEILETSNAYRYRINLETLIGVSGQSIYGDEKGEGSRAGKDFYVSILRTSPAGEEGLAFTRQEGVLYLQESGAWRPITEEEAPNPLYDPIKFARLVLSYGSISLEGEEESGGITNRRYLLQLGGDKAREAMSAGAWSYFSSLNYELNCRVRVSEASSPPASLKLEVVGFDASESLQRYRLVATLEPYDVVSSDIELPPPL